MKLSNLSVIFIIIIIPIILVFSYYVSLQVKTINKQISYDKILSDSTKEAVQAFEINTVEWNESYARIADSKRRDIMASINTFTNSFSNSLGIGGTSKENILTYIPAIAYTLYDGYYIYSPAETKEVLKNENRVAVRIEQRLVNYGEFTDRQITITNNKDKTNNSYPYENYEGKLLYVCEENVRDGIYKGTDGKEQNFTFDITKAKELNTDTNSHILKPFTAYSARYVNGDTDITVNYTLDNYITIYGNVDGDYQKRAGYLIDTKGITIPEGKCDGITLDDNKINVNPEILTEKIWYEGLEKPKLFEYVYEAENNTKVYFDGNTAFQVNSLGIRTNLNDLSSVKYKKLSIYNGDESCIEIYQALNDGIGTDKKEIKQGYWYIKKDEGEKTPKDYGQEDIELTKDVSAINYYTESYAFSEWVYKKLSNIEVDNMRDRTKQITIEGKVFENIDNKESVFNLHKREVIKSVLISNLNQAITGYSRNSEGNFYLPVLSETDWDQILTNVSIITFVQNIPIGMKYYNNYAIATSTSNKEYVDPDEIYLSTSDDKYYHLPYCDHLTSINGLIGYRSIDYKVKSYEEKDETTEEKTPHYYYKHGDNNNANQECYYCLVQRSSYNEKSNDAKKTAYETALAREKYAARKIDVPNIVIADTGEPPVEPDPETIEVFNNTSDNIKGNIDITKTGTYRITLVAGGGGGPSDRDTIRRCGGKSGNYIIEELHLEKGKYEYELGKGGEKAGDGIDVTLTIVDSILNIIKNGNITNIEENLGNIIKNATFTGTAKEGRDSSLTGNGINKLVKGGKGGGITIKEGGYKEETIGDKISELDKTKIEEGIDNLDISIFENTIKNTLKIIVKGIFNTKIYTAEGEMGITLSDGRTPGKGGGFNENGIGGYLRIEYIGE